MSTVALTEQDAYAAAWLDAPCVYAVRADQRGHLKVGYCGAIRNVHRRIAQVQTGMSEPLRIVAVYQGNELDERAAHKAFHARRLHGEWFDDSDGAISEAVGRIENYSDRVLVRLAVIDAALAREVPKLKRIQSLVNDLATERQSLNERIIHWDEASAA